MAAKRDDMMLPLDVTYLNHAAVGVLPRRSYELLAEMTKGHAERGIAGFDIHHLEDHWNDVRSTVASLVNGEKEGVTLTSNTASGLHIAIDGLYKLYKPFQNIVITELEFTTNSFAWQMLCKRHSIELRVVPFRSNDFLLQDWESLVDDNTIIIAVSHVQFSNGYRSDLRFLADLAHNHGAYLIVDAIQSIGIVPLDVKALDIDFLASGGYKWQLGPMNTGYFYANPEHLNTMESVLVGWFSSSNFMEMTHNPFTPWKDARKFQQSFDFRQLALQESIKTLKRWQVSENYNKVIALQDYLISRLNDVEGLSVASSLESSKRSGIIKLNRDRSDAMELVEYLAANKVYISARDGGLRVAPHAYNTREDIDKLLETITAWNLVNRS